MFCRSSEVWEIWKGHQSTVGQANYDGMPATCHTGIQTAPTDIVQRGDNGIIIDFLKIKNNKKFFMRKKNEGKREREYALYTLPQVQ